MTTAPPSGVNIDVEVAAVAGFVVGMTMLEVKYSGEFGSVAEFRYDWKREGKAVSKRIAILSGIDFCGRASQQEWWSADRLRAREDLSPWWNMHPKISVDF